MTIWRDLIRVLLIATFACATTGALAQRISQSMTFTVHDPCGGGNASYCGPVIVGIGIIDTNTPARFRKMSQALTTRGTLILVSPGGSLSAGIALGREIRAAALTTKAVNVFTEAISKASNPLDHDMTTLFEDGKCLSSCAYAFLGGVKRSVEADGVLGVHQFKTFGTSLENLEQGAQGTMASLQLYVQEMGVSTSYLTIASATSPDKMFMVTTSLAKRLNVDNSDQRDSGWSVKPTATGEPMVEIRRQISPERDAFVRLQRGGAGIRLMAAISLKKKLVRPDRLDVHPFDESADIGLTIDGTRYAGIPVGKWTKKDSDDVVVYGAAIELPLSALFHLARAKTVVIDDNFGTALADVSLSTDLSTNGLTNGANLLLRFK